MSDGEGVKDLGATRHPTGAYSERDFTDHRHDWTALGLGIQPRPHRTGAGAEAHNKRKHRHKRHGHKHHAGTNGTKEVSPAAVDPLAGMAPSQRVQFLLQHESEWDAQHESHRLFTEMEELDCDAQVWKEVARFVRFEEDVEEGGDRWSKPHVATLSLHSLFELRSCFLNGAVMLDVRATALAEIASLLVDKLTSLRMVDDCVREQIIETLTKRHTHQYERGHNARDSSNAGTGKNGEGGGFLQTVRSIADIGRNFSHSKFKPHHEEMESPGNALELPQPGSLGQHMSASATDVHGHPSDASLRGNQHFLKKLPPGAEASNVLIGEVDYLQYPISAFIRLESAIMLGDLTEVPVPTRFIFVLLGPKGNGHQYREIGRAIATLMSDEVFHDVAYKAHTRDDLLDGIDEFLDQVTVLPPGEWDPNIRIEPPSHVPSQEKRMKAPEETDGAAGGDEDHGGHGLDPTLKRTGRLFGGLINDIKRKAPWYLSDFRDALSLQVVASIIFMFFALLAPIVTFGGLLEEATDGYQGAIENLVSGAVCGISYHLFSGQPLTVIGSTGPVLVFETILFKLCKDLDLYYMSVRLWVGLWTSLIMMIIVATDGSALVSYITRFSEEGFACLISLIFIVEAFKKVFELMGFKRFGIYDADLENLTCKCIAGNDTVSSYTMNEHDMEKFKTYTKKRDLDDTSPWYKNGTVDLLKTPIDHCEKLHGVLDGDGCQQLHDVFLMSLLLMLGTFALAYSLKVMRNSFFFPMRVRQVISDFAVTIAVAIMVGVDLAFNIDTPKLNVPSKFEPTKPGRGWLIHPFHGNEWWTILLAIPPAFLASILLFMDQQITAVIVNRRENKLKKGCGYHLDLCVLSVLIVICSIIGIPYYVAATVLSITHVNSLRIESECKAPGEKPQFIGCIEQRVTGTVVFILIGLSTLITGVLRSIPMPVLYGVFLYMGISSLRGVQLVDRLLLLFMPMKYQPDYAYLRHVRIRRVHLFTLCQATCLALLWTIKSVKSSSIAFPLMLVVMVGVRKLLEYVFDREELSWLDDAMPEISLRKKEDKKKKLEDSTHAEEETGMKPVKTEHNLHVQLASGNVMKIPLQQQDSETQQKGPSLFEGSNVKQSGLWKHIDSSHAFNVTHGNDQHQPEKVTQQKLSVDHAKEQPRFSIVNEDDHEEGGITINVQNPSRTSTPEKQENVPLLTGQASEPSGSSV